MSLDNEDQVREDQSTGKGEMSEEDRKERGLMINPDEKERLAEVDREKTEVARDPDEWDFGQAPEEGQSYASGEADRNRGSSHTGSTDRGGAMREGTQDDRVIKGD